MRPLERYRDLVTEIAPLAPDEYYNFVFRFDEAHYRSRVEMAGFVGGARVLDAGCGFGQWAVALASANGQVVGVDFNPKMVEISRRVARHFGVANVEFRVGTLPHLDFPSATFDLIWCWGVMMFLDRRATLSEFHRLLKPGGRLFVGCVNGVGRLLYKAVRASNPMRFQGAVVRESVKSIIRGGRDGAVPNWTSVHGCRDLCAGVGLELLEAGFDGTIDVSGRRRALPMFPARFLGFDNNIEFLARKAG